MDASEMRTPLAPAAPSDGGAEEAARLVAAARELQRDPAATPEAWGRCVDRWRELAADAPEACAPHLAAALDSLGLAHLARANEAKATAAATDAVMVWRNVAARNPQKYGADLSRALRRLADRLAKDRPHECWTLREEGANVLLRLV